VLIETAAPLIRPSVTFSLKGRREEGKKGRREEGKKGRREEGKKGRREEGKKLALTPSRARQARQS